MSKLDLLQGTLDLLILRTLDAGPLHGWAISERIQQISQDVLQVNQGSLYPALHRLEHQGWIAAEWGVSELGRRARFYRLTPKGRKQLEAERESWSRLTTAIGRVLEMAWTSLCRGTICCCAFALCEAVSAPRANSTTN
jgi:PadR family transcriptional regulator, regulatory protein PadR